MFPLLMHKRNKKERSTVKKQKPRFVQHVTYESDLETFAPGTDSHLEAVQDLRTESVYDQSQDDVISINTSTAEALSSATYVTYPACADAFLLQHGTSELYKDGSRLQRRSRTLCDVQETDLVSNQEGITEADVMSGIISNLKPSKVHEKIEVVSLTDDELECAHIPGTGKTISRCPDGPVKALSERNQSRKSGYCLPQQQTTRENQLHNASTDSVRPFNDVLEISGNSTDKCEFISVLEHSTEGKQQERGNNTDKCEFISALDHSTEGKQQERGKNTDKYEFISVLDHSTGGSSNSVHTFTSSFDNNDKFDNSAGSLFHVCSLYRSPSLSPSVTFVGQPRAIKCGKTDSSIHEQNSDIHSGLLTTVTNNVIPLLPSMNSLCDGNDESDIQQCRESNSPITTRFVQDKNKDEIGDTHVQSNSKMEQLPIATCVIMSNIEQKAHEEMPITVYTTLQNQNDMLMETQSEEGKQNEALLNSDNAEENEMQCLCDTFFETSKELNPQVTWLKSASSLNKEVKDATTQISTRRVRRKMLVSRATQTVPLRKLTNKQPQKPLAAVLTNEVSCGLKNKKVMEEPLGRNECTAEEQLTLCEPKQKDDKRTEIIPTAGEKESFPESAGSDSVICEDVGIEVPNNDSEKVPTPHKLLETDTHVRHTKTKWIIRAPGDVSYRKSAEYEEEKPAKGHIGDTQHHDLNRTGDCENTTDIKTRDLTTAPECTMLTYTSASEMDTSQPRVLWNQLSPNPDGIDVGVGASESVTRTVPKLNSSDSVHTEHKDHVIIESDSYETTRLNVSATVQSKATSTSSNGSGVLIHNDASKLSKNDKSLNSDHSLYADTGSDLKGNPSNTEQVKKPFFHPQDISKKIYTPCLKEDMEIKSVKRSNCTWKVHLDKRVSSTVIPNTESPLPAIGSPSESYVLIPATSSPTTGSDKLTLDVPSKSKHVSFHTSNDTLPSNNTMSTFSTSLQESNKLQPVVSVSTNLLHAVSPDSADGFCSPLLPLPSNIIKELLTPAYALLPGISSSISVSGKSTSGYDKTSIYDSEHSKHGSRNISTMKSNSCTPTSEHITDGFKNICVGKYYNYISSNSIPNTVTTPEFNIHVPGSLSISTSVSSGSASGSSSKSYMPAPNSFVSRCNTFPSNCNTVIVENSVPGLNVSSDRSSSPTLRSFKQLPHLTSSSTSSRTTSHVSPSQTDGSHIVLTGASSTTPSSNSCTCGSARSILRNSPSSSKSKCSKHESKHGSSIIFTSGLGYSTSNSFKNSTETIKKLDIPISKTNTIKYGIENDKHEPDTDRGKYITFNNKSKQATQPNLRHLRGSLEQNTIQPGDTLKQKLNQEKTIVVNLAQLQTTPEHTFLQPEIIKDQRVTKSVQSRELGTKPEKVTGRKLVQSEETLQHKDVEREINPENKVTQLKKGRQPKLDKRVKTSKQTLAEFELIKQKLEILEQTSTQARNKSTKVSEQKLAKPEMREKQSTQPEQTRERTFKQTESIKEQTCIQHENMKEQKCIKPEKAKEQTCNQPERFGEQNLTKPGNATVQNYLQPENNENLFLSTPISTQCMLHLSDNEYMQLIANGALPLQEDVTQWQNMFGLEADVIAARARRLLAGDMSDLTDGLSDDQLLTVQRIRQHMSKLTDNELIGSISENM